MKRKTLLLLLLTIAFSSSYSQSIRLSSFSKSGALYWDIDKIFNYNNYEKARINLSASYVYPSMASKLAEERNTQWQANAYGGFATGNKRWNMGATAGAKIKGRITITPYISFRHDISLASSTYINTQSSNDIWDNTKVSISSILSAANRYIEDNEQSAAIKMAFGNRWQTEIKLSHSNERYCFDANGLLLYPIEGRLKSGLQSIAECRLTIKYNNWIAMQTTLGERYKTTPASNLDNKKYIQILTQANKWIIDNNELKYKVYLLAKAGITSRDVPYSRLWATSGTYGNLLFFDDCLSTVMPNEFQCNGFAKGLIKAERNKPLWNTRYSKATPFVQISLLHGWLWKDKENWDITSENTIDNMHVAAPTKGLAEPAIGINKLIQIGTIELGGACAYRLSPHSNNCQSLSLRRNFATTICITLKN